MTAKDYTYKQLSKKGWTIKSFEYSKPSSGFKCIEGGYLCELETNDDDWDIFEKIPYDPEIFGTIHNGGLIMALRKDDFIALVDKIPTKPSIN